jgi:Right handed beta helix region/Secretion system C-terminal sorting domain
MNSWLSILKNAVQNSMRSSYFFAVLCTCCTALQAQPRTFTADTAVNLIDGAGGPFAGIRPGDTVFLQAGNRNKLLVRNVSGDTSKAVVFFNRGGAVIISTNDYYGISINNCRCIRFSGSGDSSNFYGIQIKKVANGCGIGVGNFSTNVELDHISIQNCSTAGIYAKTDPDCTLKAVRNSFTQYNTSIHDNYIDQTGNEGMYIGSSFYAGMNITCGGKDTVVLPPVLNSVAVYNNIVQHTGWDGIQVSSAPLHCRVYNNTVLYDSQAETPNQMSGILLGGGSKCDCNNNYIADGKGDGIEDHGLAGNQLFNNIIVNAGRTYKPGDASQMKHGIFVSDVSAIPGAAFNILFNDIIYPKSDGIRFQSIKSRQSTITANLVVGPGNYSFYENGNTSFKAADAFVMLPNKAAAVQLKNNLFALSLKDAGVDTPHCTVLPGSALINKAGSDAGVLFDFNGNRRRVGGLNDIGAIEYSGGADTLLHTFSTKPLLYPNPSQDVLRVKYLLLSNTTIVFSVYTVTGAPVMHCTKAVVAGIQQHEFNIQSLPAGIYLFSLQHEKEIQYGKFVKL